MEEAKYPHHEIGEVPDGVFRNSEDENHASRCAFGYNRIPFGGESSLPSTDKLVKGLE